VCATELDRLADEVDQQATLYQSLEVVVQGKYEALDASKLEDRHALQIVKDRRVVFQGPWMYSKSLNQIDTRSGRHVNEDVQTVYDGETTKMRTNQIANFVKGKRAEPAADYLRPHNLVLMENFNYFPVSWLIRGGKAMKAYPANTYCENCEIVSEYLGEENKDGYNCEKIRVYNFYHDLESVNEAGYKIIWFAKERNLIPVRFECYHPTTGFLKPNQIGQVTEFTELGSGLYFPKEIQINQFKKDRLKLTLAPHTATHYTVMKVALDPDYDRTFFQQMTFPKKTRVYHVENDKIVSEYTVDPDATFSDNLWSWLIYCSFGLLLMLIVVVIIKMRRKIDPG